MLCYAEGAQNWAHRDFGFVAMHEQHFLVLLADSLKGR
jgi:hypothetical protein